MRASRIPTAVAMLLALAVGGCASMGESGPSNRVSGDVITMEHLQGMEAKTVWQALVELKPIWVRSGRYSRMVVYQDGIRQGRRGVLRNIQVRNVERIEFLDPRRATMEFGTNHGGGALLISTQG